MITGLKKKEKTTEIYFDEAGKIIHIRTFNTDLKKRLSNFLKAYPDEGKVLDKSEDDQFECEINKGRFSFRLTAPYSAERRKVYHLKNKTAL